MGDAVLAFPVFRMGALRFLVLLERRGALDAVLQECN